MVHIDSRAVIHPKAELGENVTVAPFAIIGEDVKIGDNTYIGPNVFIDKWVTIGKNNKIYNGTIIGTPPQDVKYTDTKTYVRIGDNNIIREYVTINRGTMEESATEIGNNNYLMIMAHVPHNCKIGNNVTLINLTGICGHVILEDNCVVSGLSGIHQYCRVGKFAMVGGHSKVVKDVPPFIMVDGNPARVRGLNLVGLKRNNFSDDEISNLKKAYKIIFMGTQTFEEATRTLKDELSGDKNVMYLIEFLQNSERGFTR